MRPFTNLQGQKMTVTYMFRSKIHQDRSLPDGDPSPEPSPLVRPGPSAAAEDAARLAVLLLRTPGGATELPAPGDQMTAPDVPAIGGRLAPFVGTEGRVILVAKARGGIGATSLAVNLALELQMLAMKRDGAVGGRVALVDLDVQLGNAGTFLDLVDRGGMLALAGLGPEPDAQAVRHALLRHPSGLNVLAAPATAIPFDAFDARRIASILDALAETHDLVIVDLPPALIDWLEPVLARAERLLMATDLAVPSITRARRLLTLLRQDRPDLPVEIVVAHEKKPFRLGRNHRDAATALGHDLRHWLPEETKLARQALDRGEPLVQLAPRCGWSKAIKRLAAELQTQTRPGTKAVRGDH